MNQSATDAVWNAAIEAVAALLKEYPAMTHRAILLPKIRRLKRKEQPR